MPIEIRELVIKATVQKVVKHNSTQPISQRDISKIKKEILDLCKEELLELLEKKDHR